MKCTKEFSIGSDMHNKCSETCPFQSPQPHSPRNTTLSEKLADIASNLTVESTKLPLLAEEVHTQDPMYF